MQKILIYGAGQGGTHLLEEIKASHEPYQCIGFIDKRLGRGDKARC